MACVAGCPTRTNQTTLLAVPTLSIHQILDARVPRRDSSRQLALWRTLPLQLTDLPLHQPIGLMLRPVGEGVDYPLPLAELL